MAVERINNTIKKIKDNSGFLAANGVQLYLNPDNFADAGYTTTKTSSTSSYLERTDAATGQKWQ